MQLREVSVIFNGFRGPVVAVVGDAKENVLIVERFVTISEVYSIITERHLEVFVLLVEFETALVWRKSRCRGGRWRPVCVSHASNCVTGNLHIYMCNIRLSTKSSAALLSYVK